jgi:hypothetical protein
MAAWDDADNPGHSWNASNTSASEITAHAKNAQCRPTGLRSKVMDVPRPRTGSIPRIFIGVYRLATSVHNPQNIPIDGAKGMTIFADEKPARRASSTKSQPK